MLSNKSKFLITGGAGFIGSALGASLVKSYGAHVVAYDSLLEQVHPTGKPPPEFSPEVELVRRDIRDGAGWRDFFSAYEPEYIVHFAAETGTAQSLVESTRHASVNVGGTTEMLDAMIATKRMPKSILLSSSRAVYGEGAWQSTAGATYYPGRRSHKQLAAAAWNPLGPDGQPGHALKHLAGSVFPNPSSIYGSTKLAQEHVLASWCDAYEVPLSMLRFQNVYGRGQSPTNPYTGIINIFHRQAARNQAIGVYEDGDIGRDFVYVDDVVASCVAAMQRTSPEVFLADIGCGQVTTILDAATIIARLHTAPQPVITGQFRDGDIRRAVADITAMTTTLGVTPTIGFDQGAQIVGDWLAETSHLTAWGT